MQNIQKLLPLNRNSASEEQIPSKFRMPFEIFYYFQLGSRSYNRGWYFTIFNLWNIRYFLVYYYFKRKGEKKNCFTIAHHYHRKNKIELHKIITRSAVIFHSYISAWPNFMAHRQIFFEGQNPSQFLGYTYAKYLFYNTCYSIFAGVVLSPYGRSCNTYPS